MTMARLSQTFISALTCHGKYDTFAIEKQTEDTAFLSVKSDVKLSKYIIKNAPPHEEAEQVMRECRIFVSYLLQGKQSEIYSQLQNFSLALPSWQLPFLRGKDYCDNDL